MGLYYNPGKVNLEEAERSILAAGGDKKVQQKEGYIPVVAYLRSENRHLSYDSVSRWSHREYSHR